MSSCVNSLYPLGDVIVGSRTGKPPLPFKDLQQYKEYVESVAKTGVACPEASIRFSTKPEKEYPTPRTSFMEFKSGNVFEQASYSAMSPYWMGPSETARAFNKQFFQ